MKRIPEPLVRRIVEGSDIVRVVGRYVRLEKRGSRWVGLCPFHTEKTPSFGVNEDRGFFFCFGCKKGGDAITFMREIERIGYVEALERLAEMAGIEIAYEGADDPEAEKAARARDALFELYERLAGMFRYLLVSDDRGRRALAYARGRSLGEAIMADFRIGYCPRERGWLHRFLVGKSYSEEFLASSGLFSRKYPDAAIFSDRLMFPISDARGRVVAFGGRLLEGDGPKYINSPETPIFRKQDTLFGFSKAATAIRSSGSAILCEGYMDVLALHAAGVPNAVAPLGTAFTESQATLLKRQAATLVLSFDSDQAGVHAAERTMAIAEAAGLAVRVIAWRDAKDPAELLEKFGADRLKKDAESTINADDFLLGNAETIAGRESSKGLSDAFAYLFPFVAGFSSEVRKDAFMEAAAARFKADPASVRADFRRYLDGARAPVPPPERVTTAAAYARNAEAVLLAALASNPDLYEDARGRIGPQDFDDELLRDAFIALEECYRTDTLGVAAVASLVSDESFRIFLLEGAASGAYALNAERLVSDGIRLVRERVLEKRKARVVARLREYDAERDGDELSLNDLLYEKMHLDGELARIKEERNGR